MSLYEKKKEEYLKTWKNYYYLFKSLYISGLKMRRKNMVYLFRVSINTKVLKVIWLKTKRV